MIPTNPREWKFNDYSSGVQRETLKVAVEMDRTDSDTLDVIAFAINHERERMRHYMELSLKVVDC